MWPSVNEREQHFLLLWAKRIAILAMGVALSFVVSWKLFPNLNERTPFLIALLLTYIITAYILLPIVIRITRALIKPDHIPLHTVTPDGFANDPINVSFVGTRHQIIKAMEKAGWHLADKRTIYNMIKVFKSGITRTKYPNAPFSNLYLFGRSQDIGFEKHVEGSVVHRHHFRLWACTNQVDPAFRDDVIFWRNKHDLLPKNQKLLWVGAAIQDEGIGFIRYHGQFTHSVLPDTNAERDLIVSDLLKAGATKEIRTIKAGEATILDNRVIGDEMITDGKLKVIIL